MPMGGLSAGSFALLGICGSPRHPKDKKSLLSINVLSLVQQLEILLRAPVPELVRVLELALVLVLVLVLVLAKAIVVYCASCTARTATPIPGQAAEKPW